MQIDDTPPRRTRIEPLLPMIDVVFFLVVFFMIASRLAPPEPFAVAQPAAGEQTAVLGEFHLFLSATGEAGFVSDTGPVTGAAARAALIALRDAHCATADCQATPPLVLLHADAKAPGSALATLLPQLAQAGFAQVSLLTVAE